MLSYFFFLICLLLPNENSKTITYPLPGFEPDRIRKANVKSLKINFFRSEYDSTLKKDTFDFVLSRQLNFDRNGNIIFCDGFMDDFWPSERQYFNFLYLEKGDYSCASYDSKGRLVEKCDINFGHDFPLYEWKVYLYDDCNNPVIVNTSDFGKPFKTDYSYYYYDNECNILEANTMLGEGSVYSSQYLYDNNCWLIYEDNYNNQNHHITVFKYFKSENPNMADQLHSINMKESNNKIYFYNSKGNLVRNCDSPREFYSYEYDDFNRLTRFAVFFNDTLSSERTWTYNENNLVIKATENKFTRYKRIIPTWDTLGFSSLPKYSKDTACVWGLKLRIPYNEYFKDFSKQPDTYFYEYEYYK